MANRQALAKSAADHRKVPGLARDFAEMVRTVRSLFNPYRPELHYMRGPGPAWRAKHAPGPAPASLNGAPALAPAQAG